MFLGMWSQSQSMDKQDYDILGNKRVQSLAVRRLVSYAVTHSWLDTYDRIYTIQTPNSYSLLTPLPILTTSEII